MRGAAFLLTLVAMAVAGCGGSGSSNGSADTGDPVEDATSVVRTHYEAFADGDQPAACSAMTEKYVAQTIKEANQTADKKVTTCEQALTSARTLAAAFLGPKGVEGMKEFTVAQASQPADGKVVLKLTFGGGLTDTRTTIIKIGEEWKVDSSDDLE